MKNRLAAAPWLVWMALFVIIPLVLVVIFAFTGAAGGFSLENFDTLTELGGILLRSFWLSILSSVICLALGYPLALCLARLPRRSQGLALTLLVLPMWMNFLLRTYSLILIIDTNGLLNRLLEALSLPPLQVINTPAAVLIGMVYNYLPFMVLPIYSVLIRIRRNVIEAAQDLGANPRQVFRRVILPQSLPGVSSGIIMVFVPAVSTFIISKMLGGGMFLLIGDYIEMQFLGNTYNPGVGSAVSLILMIVILISLFFLRGVDEDTKEGLFG